VVEDPLRGFPSARFGEWLRASLRLAIHQANDSGFRFALFPSSAVNRHQQVVQQCRGLSPDGPMAGNHHDRRQWCLLVLPASLDRLL
jgi:hypothetical protein